MTWDPGGSTQFWFAEKAGNWVQDVLQTPWDPGGAIKHQLGGKSNLMGEGLSATWALAGTQPTRKTWTTYTREAATRESAWTGRRLRLIGWLIFFLLLL